MTPVDWIRESVEYTGQKIGGMIETSPKVDRCCNSAECVELYPCCGVAEKQKHRHKDLSDRPAEGSSAFLASQLSRPVELNATRFKNLLNSFVFGSSGEVALCRKGSDNLLDCTPPSYAYLDAWHELDDDGDGLWTL